MSYVDDPSDPRRRESELFEQASELATAAEREAFLDEHCAGSPELRNKLSRLLALDDQAGKFFDFVPQAEFLVPTSADPAASDLGLRIDHYRLLRRLGEGGCGVVYMAEQLEPVRRQVALKIIRPGMDTPTGLACFEMERRALALMDHPNIARVLEAGSTPSGLPYFVMEWVQGTKITDYCDQHQLDISRRLELFVQICHAVQHAHQKGVIHRDIKPDNILVTLHDGNAAPKLIDFGVAKTFGGDFPEDVPADAGLRLIGTPSYMSPEQATANGGDVDTRCDIYSLGVLLCELLVGRPPFELPTGPSGVGPEALRRLIQERQAHRPSELIAAMDGEMTATVAERRRTTPARLLAGVREDLDWIVLQAAAGERRLRYETVNALAMDVRRCLAHEPVAAHPDSRLYRLGKLMRRNRSVFVTGSVIALAVFAGLGAATWLFVRERAARREQASLRQEAERARALEAELRQRAEVREHISQAAVHLLHGEIAAADALIGSPPIAFIPSSLECANVMRSLGTWHALAGRWPEAAARFHALGTAIAHSDAADSDDVSRDFVPTGATICEAGDYERYRDFRDLTLRRFGGTGNPVVAEQVVKAALLQPPDAAILDQLVPLAERVRGTLSPAGPSADRDAYMSAWSAFSLTLFEYRRGRPAAAIEWGERCLAYRNDIPPRKAATFAVLALALDGLGRHEEAARALAQSRAISRPYTDGNLTPGGGREGFWFDWINARILLREAEGVFASKPRS